jgi:hypothetical protein
LNHNPYFKQWLVDNKQKYEGALAFLKQMDDHPDDVRYSEDHFIIRTNPDESEKFNEKLREGKTPEELSEELGKKTSMKTVSERAERFIEKYQTIYEASEACKKDGRLSYKLQLIMDDYNTIFNDQSK